MNRKSSQKEMNQNFRIKTFGEIKSTLFQSKQLLQKLHRIKQQIDKTQTNNDQDNSQSLSHQTPEKLYSAEKIITPSINQFSLSKDQNLSKIQFIRKNIVGFCTSYISPFGRELQAVYVDHTATNRPYTPVQTMVNYAKRLIANPHTEFSHFGKFSTKMMSYAHESLLKSFSADPQEYVVLPAGSGSTGAVQKAMRIMQTFEDANNKPDIFITPYEHHSNILPWVEFYENVSTLQADSINILDLDKIQNQIKNCNNKNLIISISATSNVTSQITDMKVFNELIKKLRKLKSIVYAVDCAAFCCHHQLNLKIYDQIDFAFISPHKNLGGVETCGLLLVRKNLISKLKPSFPGGGTVSFVKGYEKQDIMYDPNVFNRQVAGTPPYLGYYRAALSFQLLKNQIGYDFIHLRQKRNTGLFVKRILEQNLKFKEEGMKTSIVVYGSCDFQKRANVITFNILSKGQIMQHSYISQILTDVFGIQLRSGCFCAGPFGMKLINLDQKMVDFMSSLVSAGILKEKPGYLRLDLTFYLQEFQIEYISKAICLTARYCQNMNIIYTICNDGQIKIHNKWKQDTTSFYGLSNFKILGEKLHNYQASDGERLRNRQQTLEKQLVQGEKIIKDPLSMLKSSQSNKRL